MSLLIAALFGLRALAQQQMIQAQDGAPFTSTTILILTSAGKILRRFSDPYLLSVRDFAVNLAGKFRVIGDARYHLDSNSDFIGQVILDPNGSYDSIQIEIGPDGSLYLLRRPFMGAGRRCASSQRAA